ncbi:hypothetical protein [Winogradskyella schleiferi]|uniref:hypothetical protein n=1 Tax=Winogradskyella schleiferi TaxID=2686078 RepID=UPI0015BD1A5C|nr:hypothetical protein [Winogradskyella schleiferi]
MKNKTLITVLGWEDRFSFGTDIILKEYNIERILLISFQDYNSMNLENKSNFLKKVKKSNIKVDQVELNYSTSINNWKTLDLFFSKYCETSDNILINITTIPRETIWTLLFFLKKVHSRINYIYFKPAKYCDDWLTKNHKNPRLLFKHSGLFDLSKNLVLFIITGFDNSRLNSLIEYYEPSKVIVFSQTGNQFDNEERNNGLNINSLLEIEKVEFNSYDVDGSTNILNDKIEEYKNSNIIISSQGPKLSSLSTYKNYIMNEEIGLSYVPAREFNDKYSIGIDEDYISGVFDFKAD